MKKWKIAENKRKYSSTPIVEIDIDKNGKEIDGKIVMVSTQTKKIGDVEAETVIELWNDYVDKINKIKNVIYED